MSSSKFPPSEGTKHLLQISNNSRNIKKPPLPTKRAPPVVKYELEPRIINVQTPTDFKYIVQLLTGDPNRPPPVYPCNCDHHDNYNNPQQPDDHPQGILSPAPTSLRPLVSPGDFTPFPSSFDQDFNSFDLLQELEVEPPTLSLSPPVINISPSPSPPPSPLPVPQPIFRVSPSMYTEIPPSFYTQQPPMFFPPNSN
ncbi:hypothetical protein E5676_scaffold1607G00250 [Cucumis melo var. makuwa]|uniref:VQ domain-containing protein n=2 Tax=Cucumis melo TaxID=3656 RepID=A0A5A7UXK4_CUCMM|nr:hypothetical protein E6C27_scaffold98G00840 [Cucumis melo var. makuwa]TYK23714.1 hypothetical protein E5676_scaffold1607G00250 [Cucumis melo var. makuwa]